MDNRAAKNKSMAFAIRMVKLYRYLSEEKKEFIISKQLLRSGTSIGANIAEAECGITKKDFLMKIYIALKETSETLYWIELLYKTGFLTERQFSSLYADANEIRKILSSTTKTVNEQK